MKNKEIFSFSDAFEPTSDLRVVHSSLSDFAPGLARDSEFPLFPAKLGVVTRFRKTRLGYVATIESEWPSLTSTTRGELILCQNSEEATQQKTLELIERCRALAKELNTQADRLRAQLGQKMIHSLGISPSDFAISLEDSGGKPRAWEIDACDKAERKEPRDRQEHKEPRARPTNYERSRDLILTPKPRGINPSALSAILAGDDEG
jgi:hypothetical protein